jgi:tripartite-type tricarboxylate transporter receptor subunit TctC
MKTIFSALLACLLWISNLSAQTPFYEGKTVRIIVGFSPGAAYDVWARLMAHHWSKYILGSPTFVVQNMTGGGSMIAANHVYNVTKPDGLTLGFVSPGIFIEQLTGSSFPMSARRRAPRESFIFAQTADTKPSRICERRESRPSAALRGLAPRVIIGPSFSPTPLDSS